jgi:hypothetical protein
MTTTIITGRDLTLTIDGKNYDAQGSSVVLSRQNEQNTLEVLDGTVYKTVNTTATLAVDMYQDWGIGANSLCEALWNKANEDPDTGLTFTFTANSGAIFGGSVLPAFPDAGGATPGELSVSLSLTVVGGTVSLTD